MKAHRLGWLLVVCAACGHKAAEAPPAAEGSAPSAAGSASAAAGIPVDHITLLEPDADIGARVTDQDALASTVKAATGLVTSYDAQHPGALPRDFDLVLAARPGALRGWLVGASGDVVVPDLERSIASLPAIPMHDGVVGLVATFAVAGAGAKQRGPYLPASWKAAAGSGGATVDDVIAKAWR